VNFYGLTLGSCRLLLFTLISAESDNLYLCTNLQKSVQYRVFKWWYYPKLYFSKLLNTAKNNGRSFDVLALIFFVWPLLKEIKKTLTVVCTLMTELVIFMSVLLHAVGT